MPLNINGNKGIMRKIAKPQLSKCIKVFLNVHVLVN